VIQGYQNLFVAQYVYGTLLLVVAAVALAALVELLVVTSGTRTRHPTAIIHSFGLACATLAACFLGAFFLIGPDSYSTDSYSNKLGANLCFNLALSFGVSASGVACGVFLNLSTSIGRRSTGGWPLWLVLLEMGLLGALTVIAVVFAVLGLTMPSGNIVYNVIAVVVLLLLLGGALIGGVVVLAKLRTGAKMRTGGSILGVLRKLAGKLVLMATLGLGATIILIAFALVTGGGQSQSAPVIFLFETLFVVLSLAWVLGFVYYYRLPMSTGSKTGQSTTATADGQQMTYTTATNSSSANLAASAATMTSGSHYDEQM
jgi:hypothetical protein